MTGFGQLVGAVDAVVLVLLGLGGVRLAGAVKRREKARLAEAAQAERAARATARDAEEARQTGRVAPSFRDAAVAEPAEPAVKPATGAASGPFAPAGALSRPTDPLGHPAGHPPGPDLMAAPSAHAWLGPGDRRNPAAESRDIPRPPFHG
jgi:hypothetical protein